MPIIEVNNLGKKYNIGERQGYVALRDVLANIARSPARWFGNKVKAAVGRDNPSEFWALKDVNFKVEQGEVLGIIGRNGAGKSTLLKILSQITPPTTGEIKLRGRVGSLLEVGTGFHPELSGRENIFLNGSILGMRKKEIEKKFDEIVEFSGIGKFLDTPVKRYSSGMYVRLAFSVAAHLEPDILIVDEVLAVGDAEFQKKCLGKMEDVTKKDGRTVIFVSHNMAAMQNLCKRCILLDKGKVAADGETDDVINQYLMNNESKVGRIDLINQDENKKAFFTSVTISDEEGVVSSSLKMGQAVKISMEFKVTQNINRLNPAVHIYNQYGQCLLASVNFHSNENRLNYTSGSYRAHCIIPANFFNDGNYSVTFALLEDLREEIDKREQIISFDIVDDLVLRGDYTGGWIGLVKPKLDWGLSKLS